MSENPVPVAKPSNHPSLRPSRGIHTTAPELGAPSAEPKTARDVHPLIAEAQQRQEAKPAGRSRSRKGPSGEPPAIATEADKA